MTISTRIGTVAVFLFTALSAIPQARVLPPPRPAGTGPTLVDTLQFIQDKMNNQDTVGYVLVRTDLSATTFRNYYRLSDVVTDTSACTLRKVETTDTRIEVADGYTYNEGGIPVTGDDLNRHNVSTSTVHLREIESTRVVSYQDDINRGFAQNAHPETTATITPEVFALVLVATKPIFSFHITNTVGKKAATVFDSTGKEDSLWFRDQDTADRLAKALTHAVELCGGGNKDPF